MTIRFTFTVILFYGNYYSLNREENFEETTVNNFPRKPKCLNEQLRTQKYKSTKKQIVRLRLNLYPSASFRYKRKAKKRFLIFLKLLWGWGWLQLNEKKSIESQTRLMSWYWKWNPTWRKDLIAYNIHPWIMFSFNSLVIILRVRVHLKMDIQGFRRSWTRGVRVLIIGQFSWVSYVHRPLYTEMHSEPSHAYSKSRNLWC